MMLLMIQQVDALMMVTSCCKHQVIFLKTQLYLYRSETKILSKSSEIHRNSRNKPVHPGILGGMIQPCFYIDSGVIMEYSDSTDRYGTKSSSLVTATSQACVAQYMSLCLSFHLMTVIKYVFYISGNLKHEILEGFGHHEPKTVLNSQNLYVLIYIYISISFFSF